MQAASKCFKVGTLAAQSTEPSFMDMVFFPQTHPAGPLYWHGGANGFNYAQMLRFVDEDLVVIVLANEDNGPARYLPMGLARTASSSLLNWQSPFDD